MSFEWDPAKELLNVSDHGLSFKYAARVFSDPSRQDREDDREDYGEERRITIGRIDERVFVVVYTERGDVIRLISARKANVREARDYVHHLQP